MGLGSRPRDKKQAVMLGTQRKRSQGNGLPECGGEWSKAKVESRGLSGLVGWRGGVRLSRTLSKFFSLHFSSGAAGPQGPPGVPGSVGPKGMSSAQDPSSPRRGYVQDESQGSRPYGRRQHWPTARGLCGT
jgi:hypothetical protein